MTPTKDILQCFFYNLIRDHLPTGAVEGIIVDFEKAEKRDIKEYQLSSDAVAQLAGEWVERLKKLQQ